MISAESFAHDICRIAKAGYLREALQVRFCIAGERLRTVTFYQLKDLASYESGIVPQPALYSIGLPFDRYCTRYRGRSLADLAVEYVSSHFEHFHTDSLECTAFPSRKGSTPITPRTAERRLQLAAHAAGVKGVSFQTAKRVGKLLHKQASDTRYLDDFPGLLKSCQASLAPLYRLLFPHEGDRDDALQDGAIQLLNSLRDGKVVPKLAHCVSFLQRFALAFSSRLRRYKCQFAPGIFEDISMLTIGGMQSATRGEFLSRAGAGIEADASAEDLRASAASALELLTEPERFVVVHRLGPPYGRLRSLSWIAGQLRTGEDTVALLERDGKDKVERELRIFWYRR